MPGDLRLTTLGFLISVPVLALMAAASEPEQARLGDRREHAIIEVSSSYCFHRKEHDPTVLRATVEIEVGENGNASNVNLIIPDPTTRLNRAAVMIAKRRKFELPPGSIITREIVVNCDK